MRYSHLTFDERTAVAHAVNAFHPFSGWRVTAATVDRVSVIRAKRSLREAIDYCKKHPPGSSLMAPSADARRNAELAERMIP